MTLVLVLIAAFIACLALGTRKFVAECLLPAQTSPGTPRYDQNVRTVRGFRGIRQVYIEPIQENGTRNPRSRIQHLI